MERTEALQL